MTHDERLALIYRPFFITRFGSSYPHAGAAAGDNFYDTKDWAHRPAPMQWETGSYRGGYPGLLRGRNLPVGSNHMTIVHSPMRVVTRGTR